MRNWRSFSARLGFAVFCILALLTGYFAFANYSKSNQSLGGWLSEVGMILLIAAGIGFAIYFIGRVVIWICGGLSEPTEKEQELLQEIDRLESELVDMRIKAMEKETAG